MQFPIKSIYKCEKSQFYIVFSTIFIDNLIMSDFVTRIDNLLTDQNKKRSDLYEYVKEINSHSMYDWLRRNTVPSANIAVKIAQFLGTSVEYLVTGKDTNPLADENSRLKNKIQKAREILS